MLVVLLCFIHETFYRAYRAWAISGRKALEPIDNPHKYDGQRIVIGSVTDGYHPYEEDFCRNP